MSHERGTFKVLHLSSKPLLRKGAFPPVMLKSALDYPKNICESVFDQNFMWWVRKGEGWLVCTSHPSYINI